MEKQIIKNIIKNQNKILSNIDEESILVYLFLKNEYKNGDVKNNKVFQFVFRSFYRLDNAGLDNDFKNRYFELLSKNKNDLKSILIDLYEFKNRKKQKTIQFSFATKLLHTIDNHLPIFDAEASRVLKVKVSGNTKEEKIISRINAYQKLKDIYILLLKDKDIFKLIQKFKIRFKLKEDEVSNEKILDFIIWSLGKIN